eukprot:scaffold36312_cov132-Isochrysis_galbana.AAC.3
MRAYAESAYFHLDLSIKLKEHNERGGSIKGTIDWIRVEQTIFEHLESNSIPTPPCSEGAGSETKDSGSTVNGDGSMNGYAGLSNKFDAPRCAVVPGVASSTLTPSTPDLELVRMSNPHQLGPVRLASRHVAGNGGRGALRQVFPTVVGAQQSLGEVLCEFLVAPRSGSWDNDGAERVYNLSTYRCSGRRDRCPSHGNTANRTAEASPAIF